MALSEKEQIELFSSWWKENGMAVVVTVVVTVAAYFGWNAWKKHEQTQAEKASALYQELLDAKQQEGGIQAHLEKAKQLKNDYPGTFYGAAVGLLLAEQAVKDGQLDNAAQHLKDTVAAKPEESLLLTARLRLARVLYAQGLYDEAAKQLEGEVPAAFEALYAELRGDVQLAQGKMADARSSYQAALKAMMGEDEKAPKSMDTQVLEMKISSIAAP